MKLTSCLLVGLALSSLASAQSDPLLEQLLRASDAVIDRELALLREPRARSRRSAALPKLRVDFERDWDGEERADELAQGPRRRVSRENAIGLKATIEFDLRPLLYGRNELSWSRELRYHAERKRERRERVLSLFYKHARLRRELSHGLVDPLEGKAALERAAALLDLLTEGEFTRARNEAETSRDAKSRAIR